MVGALSSSSVKFWATAKPESVPTLLPAAAVNNALPAEAVPVSASAIKLPVAFSRMALANRPAVPAWADSVPANAMPDTVWLP